MKGHCYNDRKRSFAKTIVFKTIVLFLANSRSLTKTKLSVFKKIKMIYLFITQSSVVPLFSCFTATNKFKVIYYTVIIRKTRGRIWRIWATAEILNVAQTWLVPLKIVFNVLRSKPALNWNQFLADLRHSSNSLNSDSRNNWKLIRRLYIFISGNFKCIKKADHILEIRTRAYLWFCDSSYL